MSWLAFAEGGVTGSNVPSSETQAVHFLVAVVFVFARVCILAACLTVAHLGRVVLVAGHGWHGLVGRS